MSWYGSESEEAWMIEQIANINQNLKICFKQKTQIGEVMTNLFHTKPLLKKLKQTRSYTGSKNQQATKQNYSKLLGSDSNVLCDSMNTTVLLLHKRV